MSFHYQKKASLKPWLKLYVISLIQKLIKTKFTKQIGENYAWISDDIIIDGFGYDRSGVADDEGHAQGFFVHEALVVPAVVAQEKALIGSVNDHGIVGDAIVFQVVEEAAYVVVDAGNPAQVVLYKSLL